MVVLWLAFEWFLGHFPVMRDYIDSSSPYVSILHRSEIAQIVGELPLVANRDDARMIFIGSSDMQIVFRPEQVQKLFPQRQIDSMCRNGMYGGGNVGEDLRIMQAALAVMTPAARSESVFIVGVSFSTFFSRKTNDVESQFDTARETMFPRLFKTENGKADHVVSPQLYVGAARLLRPFFAARRFGELSFQEQTFDFAWKWLNASPKAMSKTNGLSACSRSDVSKDVRKTLHPPSHTTSDLLHTRDSSNYRYFADLLSYAEAEQIKLVIVQLPTVPLLQERYPEYRIFTRQIRDAVEEMKSSNIWFLDMSELLGNGCFRDGNHIIDEAASRCAYELKMRWPLSKER